MDTVGPLRYIVVCVLDRADLGSVNSFISRILCFPTEFGFLGCNQHSCCCRSPARAVDGRMICLMFSNYIISFAYNPACYIKAVSVGDLDAAHKLRLYTVGGTYACNTDNDLSTVSIT